MIKKKRVIKVPKAQNGLENNNTWYAQQLEATKPVNMAVAQPTPLGQMPTPQVQTSSPKVKNTNSDLNVGGIVSAAPQALSVLSGIGAPSNATTGREAVAQSVQDIAQGMSVGTQIGASIGGPFGGIIGGGIGGAVGLIGKSGREASMSSFTDYDEGTLGTGLIGAFSNRKLRRERARIKMNALNNRAAVAGTEYLQSEYAEENGGANTNTFAEGGSIPSSLAYVDDGELISTPDGTVSKVPEQGRPVDSNLVSLPEGSRVLSNTLKVPGTKKTFAQLGEEMMTKRKSKGRDRFAENANKLNEMNNKQIHDMLFAQQEAIKARKGTKKEYKNLVEEFQVGGEKRISQNIQYYPYGPEITKFSGWSSELNDYDPRYLQFVNSLTDNQVRDIANGQLGSMDRYNSRNRGYIPTISEARQLMTDRKYGDWHKWVEPLYQNWLQNNPNVTDNITMPTLDPTPVSNITQTTATSIDEMPLPRISSVPIRVVAPESKDNNIDWLGALSGLSGLAPIISNLFTADPEPVRANYNPYTRAISNAMSRRRFNIEPAIQDMRRNRSVTDYNASQMNTNTGANMAYRLQSAIAQNNAIADIRAQENNVNNQYRGEYANMMNNLGQQFVAANNLADDLNAQNRASARNIRRAGLSQLSGWFQNRELMHNQRERDRQMLDLYRPMLQYGFTPQEYSNLLNSLR